MATQVNLTESQQTALNVYRKALANKTGHCCNEGCTTCGIHRLRIKLEGQGIPAIELQKILDADTLRKTAQREAIEKLSEVEKHKPQPEIKSAEEAPKSYP